MPTKKDGKKTSKHNFHGATDGKPQEGQPSDDWRIPSLEKDDDSPSPKTQ